MTKKFKAKVIGGEPHGLVFHVTLPELYGEDWAIEEGLFDEMAVGESMRLRDQAGVAQVVFTRVH